MTYDDAERPLLLGLVGAGIGGSLSRPLHEREGRACGIPLIYRPVDAEALGLGVADLPDVLRWAARLGFEVAVLDPEADCPAGRVAAHRIIGRYDDTEALDALAAVSAVVTTAIIAMPTIAAIRQPPPPAGSSRIDR